MQNLLKYVSDVLNIKAESIYTIADMKEELETIKDIAAYRHYIRDNIDHFDADYKTGFQKFIVLTRKYKDLETRALHGMKAKSYAKIISDKVISCRTFVEDTPSAFSLVKIQDSENMLFEKHELRALQSIGSISYIIEMSKAHSLERMIEMRYVSKKSLPKPYEQLDERMNNLINDTTKRIISCK